MKLYEFRLCSMPSQERLWNIETKLKVKYIFLRERERMEESK